MTDITNNSGQGANSPVLDIVAKKFNWGAFWLSWIWGLGNKTYITFVILIAFILSIIPILGVFIPLGVSIWFGIKGNQWAWQNKKWESVEQFHRVQKIWAIIGTIFAGLSFVLCFIGIIAALTLPTLLTNTNKAMESTMSKKSFNNAMQAVMMNEALEEKCEYTSEGLAQCFEKRLNIRESSGNRLKLADDTVWLFEADGNCATYTDCKIDVQNNDKTIISIPLKRKDDGYLQVDTSVMEKLIY